jgi:ABC-type transporter Mla MlaB component
MMKRNASMAGVRRLVSPASAPERADTLDLAVVGGLLVERQQDGDHLELKLFGQLDRESAQFLSGDLPAGTELLDLTELDSVDPGALQSLTERQRAEHAAGHDLRLRIAPHQVSALRHPAA